tara:strand:- start:393 stop:2180 length:1788 start_codon:yes stop_codon:yes gene_type:complete
MKLKFTAAFIVFFLISPGFLLALDSHFVMVRGVYVTPEWTKFDSGLTAWDRAALIKKSDRATYLDVAIWEEIGAIHFYEFPNEYLDNMATGIRYSEKYKLLPNWGTCDIPPSTDSYWDRSNESISEATVLAARKLGLPDTSSIDEIENECKAWLARDLTDYRESFAILKVANMPSKSARTDRSIFLKQAIIQFLKIVVPRFPNSEYSLTYSGHGGPGGALFEGMLSPQHSYDVLKTWRYLIGKNLAFIDMGGPCNKAGFSDLSTFCPFANYYIASDLPNGGYRFDDWTFEKFDSTDADTQWHNIFPNSNSLLEAMKKRIDLTRQRYLYAVNDMTTNKTEQANYLFSCAAFNLFSPKYAQAVKEAAGSFYGTLSNSNLGDNGHYDLMESVRATGDGYLIEALNQVKLYQADNRDFFEWEEKRNGISTPNFQSGYGSAVNLDFSKALPATPTDRPKLNTSNTSNSESTASISGGITKDGGLTYSNWVFPGDTISIRPIIEPDASHLGKLLEIIVVLQDKANELFLLTSNGLTPYASGDSISYFSQTMGTSQILVTILDDYKYTGGNPNEYNIYIGYRLADKADDIFYNLEPIKMSLN